MTHKAGFVSIVGKPNVGKSTLMNQLVGERLSIINKKAQTTRHRIMGILSAEEYQIVYSDTPGIIDPKYKLQEAMMNFVQNALADADIILWVIDRLDTADDQDILERLQQVEVPLVIVLNKVDQQQDQEEIKSNLDKLQEKVPFAQGIIPVSALHNFNVEGVLQVLLELLPEHPPFFPKDELTDKPLRFFAAEIIREKILHFYKQEIPYACEVVIVSFKNNKDILRISAEIMVERASQKSILIGKGGSMLKKVGTSARKDMEAFFQKKVFLEQYVKVESAWREKSSKLRQFGYE